MFDLAPSFGIQVRVSIIIIIISINYHFASEKGPTWESEKNLTSGNGDSVDLIKTQMKEKLPSQNY